MKVFNIGIPELVFLGLLALIVLGPERIVKTARSLGIWVRKVTKSPLYQDVVTTSQELRDLPRKIMRESGLEEPINEINKTLGDYEHEILRNKIWLETQEECQEKSTKNVDDPSHLGN